MAPKLWVENYNPSSAAVQAVGQAAVRAVALTAACYVHIPARAEPELGSLSSDDGDQKAPPTAPGAGSTEERKQHEGLRFGVG